MLHLGQHRNVCAPISSRVTGVPTVDIDSCFRLAGVGVGGPFSVLYVFVSMGTGYCTRSSAEMRVHPSRIVSKDAGLCSAGVPLVDEDSPVFGRLAPH